jgi:polysaccharide biosynthesis protein PslG
MTVRLFVFCAAFLVATVSASAQETDMKNNPFCILEFLYWDHEWNNNQYASVEQLRTAVRMMKDAGVGMVRMDFLWQDVEPQQGRFDFAKYDRIVELLRERGIAILGIFNYSTDWASPTCEWNVPPRDNSAFVAYVRKVAQRYKGKVSCWEVWNEPDSRIYWKEQDGLVSYCAMLRESYLALKEIDPACTVLNGGLTNELCSVNYLYDNGGKGYFDALNIHVFDNPLHQGAEARLTAYVKACARIMKRNGDAAKKIWVTEVGCPGVNRGKVVKDWWLGKNPDEKLQAAWVTQVFKTLLAEPQVEKVFWTFFRDTREHWKDGTDYFGLVRNDFSAKPALTAYTNAARARQERGRK